MTESSQTLLRIPQGTERFSLEEAYRHRRLVHRIEEFYDRWGYMPTQTPVVDFYDVYDPLLTPADRRGSYRLIDRDGEVLLLRSDVTLFLAKQMGLLLRPDDLPVRVSYADTILRHQEAYDISRNEFFQTGVELIGVEGNDGEVEVLTLLFDLLRHVGSPRFYIHIGSRSVLTAGPLAAIEAERHSAVLRAVALRRFDELDDLLGGHLTPARRRLYSLILDGDEFLDRLPDLHEGLEEGERRAVDHLAVVAGGLIELGYGEQFRIDFSEVGNQSYHSGMAFQGYVDGVDSAVAAGGRYDGLLRRFGFDAASVGFSVMLRKLEPLLNARPEPETAAGVQGVSIGERLRRAREIVSRGGRVSL